MKFRILNPLLAQRGRLISATLLGAALLLPLTGCDATDAIADACPGLDFSCSSEGIVEGNASISGVVSIDAFFGAVVTVRDVAAKLSLDMRAELEGLAATLGIKVEADMSIGDLAGEIEAKIKAEVKANVEGELSVEFQPPRCEANVEVVAKATAECSAEVEPGSVEIHCEGKCEIDAELAADCKAEAELICVGQAPDLKCEGSCTGSCTLEAAARCEGSCQGSCSGSCSACAGGECKEEGGVITNCVGSCDAMCEGSCELEAAGTCKGSCEGSCEWTPPKAECEGNAKVVCNMEADVEIECKAGCEGEVRPPKVEAECNAAIEARAKAEIECHPPALDINFKYKAGIDAKAQAEFRAMLRNFKIHYSAMLALEAQLVALVEASGDLAAEAGGAVEGAVSAALKAAEGETELAVRIKLVGGLSCAISELENVGKALKDATEDADASISALATVSSGFKTRTR